MQSEMGILIITAISVACLHTVTGPDHYLPFVALSKSRNWSLTKTIGWTIICGCGHIWSSVLLGLGGAAIGWSLSKINFLEGVRGGIAGWVMLTFGFFYGIWGLYRAYKNNPHKHFDLEDGGDIYVYEHRHGEAITPSERHKVTPWVMFIIFLLGPCEPMIPLLYFPAAQNSWWGMLLLIAVYTFFTLVTMLTMVLLGYFGIAFVKTEKIERYVHAIGGLTIFICGAGMVFMGW
ncbi:sulfite exporter TauE/SafE family protein [Ferruginibacter sp. SUN002]|uniref:urease accessory protein UreH domain-containing protein n=1 Tax=Ferruginibacter sp. SUN002 TaxID=2937789 RepID=UPI003D368AEA